MMDCELFKIVAGDLARDRCSDERMRRSALDHAKACPACAERLQELRRLVSALDELAAATAEKKASQHVEDYLLLRFRQWNGGAARHNPVWRRGTHWGAAAAAVGALAVGWWLLLAPARQHNRRTVAVPGRSAVHTVLAAPSSDSEVAQGWPADFLPLPSGEDSGPMTAAQVVTVKLSAEDLQEIGLPADELGSQNQVTAEIVIGEDGIARGIRFLQ